ncbi:MAG TPA: hypothetical protein PLP66_14955 [Phycisphaerae bacterium]|nr:hypothetical protein [Phycisphaerae bacterium]
MILIDWWSRLVSLLAGRPGTPQRPDAEAVAAAADYRLRAVAQVLDELAEFRAFADSRAGRVVREQLGAWISSAQDEVLRLIADPAKHRTALQTLAAEVTVARELLAVFDGRSLAAAAARLDEDRRQQHAIKERATVMAQLAPTVGKDVEL